MKTEIRMKQAEVRAEGDEDQQFVSGLGIVYDTEEMIFPGLMEKIRSGSVKQADSGVQSFFNHDPSAVLSSLDSDPPLELKDGKDGLHYRSIIPDTSYGKDLATNLARGAVKGSSFAFEVVKDTISEDEEGTLHREITELILHEVGPVTSPAYSATSAELKSQLPELRQRARGDNGGTPPVSDDDDDDPPVSADVRKRERELLIRHGQLRPDDAA